uniref:Uncharacterized protein n=1 Tax=Fagus sylvatica TaxID=28930 RepID=A0A2N9EQ53_FAGSY
MSSEVANLAVGRCGGGIVWVILVKLVDAVVWGLRFGI